jgi:hypothetical protein
MTQVLTFRAAAPGRRKASQTRTAEIVIFPGVRVEYHQDGHGRAPATAPRREAELGSAKVELIS